MKQAVSVFVSDLKDIHSKLTNFKPPTVSSYEPVNWTVEVVVKPYAEITNLVSVLHRLVTDFRSTPGIAKSSLPPGQNGYPGWIEQLNFAAMTIAGESEAIGNSVKNYIATLSSTIKDKEKDLQTWLATIHLLNISFFNALKAHIEHLRLSISILMDICNTNLSEFHSFVSPNKNSLYS
jgi:hypothetical protein